MLVGGDMRISVSPTMPGLTIRQVLLMCQLRHPNIVSAEDVYFSTDMAPSAHAASAARAQDFFVCMPYYPADLAWLIHCSTQVLTSRHIQAHQLRAISALPPALVHSCPHACLL
jgi:hypothetical protein